MLVSLDAEDNFKEQRFHVVQCMSTGGTIQNAQGEPYERKLRSSPESRRLLAGWPGGLRRSRRKLNDEAKQLIADLVCYLGLKFSIRLSQFAQKKLRIRATK
jgi:hypothetical protein